MSLLLKLTPESLADKIPKFLDESEKLDESNKTMRFFNSANTKVTDIKLLKKSAAPAEPETKNEDEEQKSAWYAISNISPILLNLPTLLNFNWSIASLLLMNVDILALYEVD